MAKFNIEVELGWMYEGNVDQELKQELIDNLTQKLFEKIEDEIEEVIQKEVSKNIDETINKKLLEYMDEFMDHEFKQVDNWGRVKNVTTPKKRLIELLDNFYEEKVDERGRLDNYGRQTRLDYMLGETAKEHIRKYQKGISDQVLEGIKEDINKETQERVVKSILSDYDLKKLIGKA